MTDKNIFDSQSDRDKVPVTIVVEGEKIVVGEASITDIGEGLFHADITVKTDDVQDLVDLFHTGITGYSIVDEDSEKMTNLGPHHRMTVQELQKAHGLVPHDHVVKQHRDGKPPWCPTCRRDAEYNVPQPNRFNFGKPANPLHPNS